MVPENPKRQRSESDSQQKSRVKKKRRKRPDSTAQEEGPRSKPSNNPARKKRRPHQGGRKKKPGNEPVITRKTQTTAKAKPLIPGEPGRVRLIPLGGVEEVGRNMMVIEVGCDIFICDVGFEFATEQAAPGIKYILPNTTYLEERQHLIRAAFITHGHLDHIGGIPYLMERIGNPPIYTRALTAKLIEKRQEEFRNKPKLKFHIVEPGKRIRISDTYLTPFEVTHSIPESMGLKVETPQGAIVISGDFKLDHIDGEPTAIERARYEAIGEGKNLVFIADSTNAERSGFSITEREVQDNIADIIRRTEGRIIVGTFASQLARIIKVIEVAEETGRKVVIEGKSIRTNLVIAHQTGLIKLNEELIIHSKEIKHHPPENIVIIATGAQGEPHAALSKIAYDRHRDIKLKGGDTVILSSSIIPGNERSVQTLKDALLQEDLHIVHYRTSDVHSTGHGNAGELIWINRQVGAKYFIPAYGFRSMTQAHAKALEASGFDPNHIIMAENGSIIDFVDGEPEFFPEKAPAEMLVVDGEIVGSADSTAIIERRNLAQSGVLIVALQSSQRSGRYHKPVLEARGIAGSHYFLNDAKKLAERLLERSHTGGRRKMSPREIVDQLKSSLSRFVEDRTSKQPVVVVLSPEGGA